MECDQPRAGSASPCHEEGVPDDGATFRGVPHACDHDRTGGSPALLASATGRDSVGASLVAASPTLMYGLVPEAGMAAAAVIYGPPGLSGRSTSSHLTVLRI